MFSLRLRRKGLPRGQRAALLAFMTHRFGPCELDPDRRILRRDGHAIHIEPQVFDLLLALIEANGRVVTKEALIETVWRGRNVSDATISSRINDARKA